MESTIEEPTTSLVRVCKSTSQTYLASFGLPCSKSNIESSIGMRPSAVPCRELACVVQNPSGRRLTLMSRSRVDGVSIIPVSSRENFFCAPATNSGGVAYPCFIDTAGQRLVDDQPRRVSMGHSTYENGYSCPSAFSIHSRPKKKCVAAPWATLPLSLALCVCAIRTA